MVPASHNNKHKLNNINGIINEISILGNIIRILVYNSNEHHNSIINHIDKLKLQYPCIHLFNSEVELKNTSFNTYCIKIKL